MSSLDEIFAKKPSAKRKAASSLTSSSKKRLVEKPIKVVKVAKSGPVIVEKEIDQEALDAQEIFRRHFETQFKPLPPISAKKEKKSKKSKAPAVVEEEELSDEEGSDDGLGDFDGLSEDSGSSDDEMGGMDDDSQFDDDSDEEDGVMATPGTVGKSKAPLAALPMTVVEVVEHDREIERPRMTKAEMKAFMSSKPPTDPSSIVPPDALKLGDPDEAGEKDNLKNDLALQRLLAESHLIESGAESLNHTGKAHHKATDLRLQALGAKGSVFTQKSMPLFMRKGMLKKSTEKEEKRRTEARENGIILERIKGGKAGKERRPQDRRERGVGAPAVGRFEGGTLKISKRDVYEIEGPKKREGKGGRGGGRGGRGGKRGGRGK